MWTYCSHSSSRKFVHGDAWRKVPSRRYLATKVVAPLCWRHFRHLATWPRGIRRVPHTSQQPKQRHPVHHGGRIRRETPLPRHVSEKRWIQSNHQSVQEADPYRQIYSLLPSPPKGLQRHLEPVDLTAEGREVIKLHSKGTCVWSVQLLLVKVHVVS